MTRVTAVADSGASEVLVEAGRAARGLGRALRRGLPRLLTGVAVLVTALCLVAFAGALADDVAITSDRGTATAEVLDAGFGRTLVRFPTPDGQLRVPERGVYYPGGLQTGQTVDVEYARADPDLVRVAERTAWTGVPVLLAFAAGGWVVFGGAAYLVRRRRQAAAVHQE
jgi:hypothetical protein